MIAIKKFQAMSLGRLKIWNQGLIDLLADFNQGLSSKPGDVHVWKWRYLRPGFAIDQPQKWSRLKNENQSVVEFWIILKRDHDRD